jgi:hypothetical protein
MINILGTFNLFVRAFGGGTTDAENSEATLLRNQVQTPENIQVCDFSEHLRTTYEYMW